LVDVSGPELSITCLPEYFSPDNDGVEDDLFITLQVKDASPIASWSLEIHEPEAPSQAFYRVEGKGRPAERIVWDGRSNKGELVQSATDYPYTFRAEDSLGNVSSKDGKIGVDILVIRDGDLLRIQIPSIQFESNSPKFDSKFDERNAWILQRIARSLNKFRDYKVTVEGHVNPTTPLGPQRDREEPGNIRLSQQRAQTVVDQLVKNGVVRSRLKAEGAGSSRTVAPYDDLDNRWRNRRVEFILNK
jgi:outer membrane protein OmpA-like peptidoglycan-associated protein